MPGVGLGIIVLNKNNEILLLLRNSNKEKADSDMRLEGTWTLPAGKIKSNETMMNAASRKLKEETNLYSNDFEIICIQDDINEYAHFVTLGLICKSYSNKIKLSSTEEHVEYKFYNINNLPDNLCEPSKKIIKSFLEKNRIN